MNELTPIQRLTRDLANAARTMTDEEARFLVDNFYQMQDGRIRADGQIRSINKTPAEIVETPDGEAVPVHEPHEVLTWFSNQSSSMENQIQRALEKYVNAHVMGDWLMNIFGIGPVISAGLLAHIDMEWEECTECGKKKSTHTQCKCEAPFQKVYCETAGQIWRYAGLDPTSKWEKKTARPWNAQLKVVCWKAGESFWKFHNDKRCFYGHLFDKQKKIYIERNERGVYEKKAAEMLATKNFRKTTDAYKAYIQGKLPPAHIHSMARRHAVKIFLAHLHGEMCRRILGKEPPLPWILEFGGHSHLINPPS